MNSRRLSRKEITVLCRFYTRRSHLCTNLIASLSMPYRKVEGTEIPEEEAEEEEEEAREGEVSEPIYDFGPEQEKKYSQAT